MNQEQNVKITKNTGKYSRPKQPGTNKSKVKFMVFVTDGSLKYRYSYTVSKMRKHSNFCNTHYIILHTRRKCANGFKHVEFLLKGLSLILCYAIKKSNIDLTTIKNLIAESRSNVKFVGHNISRITIWF